MVVKMKLILSNLKARDLMDTGTMFDPQDPSLHIKLGEIHQLTTERIQDARSNADFDETFETEVSIDDYNKGIDIEVEAFNINNAPGKLGKKIHIGKGTINLKTAIPKFNKVVSISIAMTHTSKKGVFRKGRIEMDGLIEVQENQVRLNSVKQTMNFVGLGLASSIGLGNDGKRLRVTVNSMKALNLVDTGSRLDPQDPALWIKIGDSYNMTARQQDARCNATFDELYQYEVSGEAYDTGVEIEVEVFNINESVKKVTTMSKNVIGSLAVGRQFADSIDDNLVKKVHVGKGSIVLKTAAPKFGHVHSVTIPLKHNGKKKTVQQGILELDVMVEILPGRTVSYHNDEDREVTEEPSCLHQLQVSIHDTCAGVYASACMPCVEYFTRPQDSLASQVDTEEDGAELPVRKQSMQRERISKRGFVPLRDT